MTVNTIMKIICTAVEEMNISNPCSYEHYLTSGWNKAWKKIDFSSQCQYDLKESSDEITLPRELLPDSILNSES